MHHAPVTRLLRQSPFKKYRTSYLSYPSHPHLTPLPRYSTSANLFGHVERSHSSPNLARVVLSDSRQGSRSATPQGSRTVSRTVTPRGSRAPSPVRASSLLVDDSQVDSYPADVCVEHGDAVECKSLPAWAQDYADLMSLPEGASTPQKLQLVKKVVAQGCQLSYNVLHPGREGKEKVYKNLWHTPTCTHLAPP